MTTRDETPSAATGSTEDFAHAMMGAIDGASVAILASIGHQTGLFDTMAGLLPSTSSQIADAAGLNERYVREWLGGMVAGRVVDYEPASATYSLPPHHAAVLTRAAGPDNLARVAQYISLLGEIEPKIIGCFRTGGGLPYSEYPRFHAIMAEQSGEVFDAALVDVVLPLAQGLPERLRTGVEVADWGCGSGHAINVMALAFPHSRFTGIDFSDEGVATGGAEAARLGLTNATFERQDVAQLDKPAAYDVITVFDAIHDQAQLARVLSNIYRASPTRRLPDGRHQGLEPSRGQRQCPAESLPLHLFDDALHECVAGLRRCGPWHDVGSAAHRFDAGRRRFQRRHRPGDRVRPGQQLLRGPQVSAGCHCTVVGASPNFTSRTSGLPGTSSARNHRKARLPRGYPSVVTALGCAAIPREITTVTEPSVLGTAVWPLIEVRASVTQWVAMNWFHTTRFQNRHAGGRWVMMSASSSESTKLP
jgi:SAM-dependent methyltransferase